MVLLLYLVTFWEVRGSVMLSCDLRRFHCLVIVLSLYVQKHAMYAATLHLEKETRSGDPDSREQVLYLLFYDRRMSDTSEPI